jgi:hypothetical protein
MILDILNLALRDWAPDTNAVLQSLTETERIEIALLAEEAFQRSTGNRTKEQVLVDCQNGKMGEYAIIRHLQAQGFEVEQNIETITKEHWWDLKLHLDGQSYNIEIKRQTQRSRSINFTRPQSLDTMCQSWRQLHAIIVWVPEGEWRPSFGGGKSMSCWCILSNEVLNPTNGLFRKLDFKPTGFCFHLADIPATLSRVLELP